MNFVDLHVHSKLSDGTFSPKELVSYAKEKGLFAFALTDHDTISGVPEAMEAGKHLSVTVVPGIEFSAIYQGKDIHIVGLFLDIDNPLLLDTISRYQKNRDIRNEQICEKFTACGIPMTLKDLQEAFPGAILTRAHYARYLMDKGITSSVKEGFETYVSEGCPCFVPKVHISPQEAISVILQAGGVPVLAHPVLYHLSDKELRSLIETFIGFGLKGIEAIYSTYTLEEERYIRRLAKEYGLLISGGSDFHGTNKPHIDLAVGKGHLFVPDEVYFQLKSAGAHSDKK